MQTKRSNTLPHKRSVSRDMAFKAIYAASLTDELKSSWQEQEPDGLKYDKTYFRKLFGLYKEHKVTILNVLNEHIALMKSSETSDVELSILQMGVTEIMYIPTTPKEVCIHEAIELAHKYGSEKGYAFVHAVLDAVCKRCRS